MKYPKHTVVEGQQFGKWTVLKNRQPKNVRVPVRCVCGLEKFIWISSLVNGASKGCIKCNSMRNGNKHERWKGFGKVSGKFFGSIQDQANRRGISFELTITDVVSLFEQQQEKCAFTGRTLVFGTGRRYHKNTTASLDRIDSSKGYIKGNVQWVHKHVNLAKRSMTQQEFINLCREVVSWQK